MKRSTGTLELAALLVALLDASADAQTNVVVNDPSDTGETTVYYSVCPTALTTTTTLSSTMTFCPGGQCGGGGALITPPPNANAPAVNEILAYTTTLPDGSVEEIHEYVTVYPAICSDGSSIGQATYYITEPCPCEATKNPASIPAGFTTSVTSCDVCNNGGPTTMTVTMPCTTGPYATVTPEIGPTGAAGANAQAAASAGANAEAEANTGSSGGSGSSDSGTGSGSGSSGTSGSGSSGAGSTPNAAVNANANAAAGASSGYNGIGSAGSNSASSGNSAAGSNSAAGGSNAAANANANAQVGANSGNRYDNGTTGGNSTISPPITPVAPSGASGVGSANNAKFTASSADKVRFAASGVLAVVAGCLAFML